MNKLSFEYCHIYPGQNVKKENLKKITEDIF